MNPADSALPSDDPEFLHVVSLLRALPIRIRHMALYAACFWSDERLRECEAYCVLQDRAGIASLLPEPELMPPSAAAPKAGHLKLVATQGK
jgi:hypothetical protein